MHSPELVQNVGRNTRQPVHLRGAIRHASQENRDVIVGVGSRLAPRARAVKHDAFEA